MNQRVKAIVDEAQKLAPEERRDLFDQLDHLFLDEPSEGTPAEIEAAWLDEVQRRASAHESGEMEFSPAGAVRARLKARLERS